MVAEIISIGTELLMGNITNTNAVYFARQCAALGIDCYYQDVVGDNEERMTRTIRTALDRADLILLSGGLGPTEDDLTKEIVCRVMDEPLVEDPHSRARIQSYMESHLKSNPGSAITDNNWKQALVPEHGKVLDNENGTAPGLIIEKNGKTAVLLPGPPIEMKPMFEEQVIPYLRSRQESILYSHMIKICGIGESAVETAILDLIAAQTNPTLATYAKTGEVHLRVTAKAGNEEEALALMEPVEEELKKRFGTHIYTTDEKVTLEEAVVQLLKERNLHLTTAESCTGGAVSSRIVNVPGASEVLEQGIVTYSNRAKEKYLGVRHETLENYGAVSPQTAEEMASGGCALTGTEACISITGIAGPGGGTEAKPVGLVYMGCCIRGITAVQEFRFRGNREKIREQSVVKALAFLRQCILNVMDSEQ